MGPAVLLAWLTMVPRLFTRQLDLQSAMRMASSLTLSCPSGGGLISETSRDPCGLRPIRAHLLNTIAPPHLGHE
jgi:hypothetical protein